MAMVTSPERKGRGRQEQGVSFWLWGEEGVPWGAAWRRALGPALALSPVRAAASCCAQEEERRRERKERRKGREKKYKNLPNLKIFRKKNKI
jgi:hypothetical protein